MKKVLVVLGVLALLGVAAVVVAVSFAKGKLEPLAEAILVDCRAGKVDDVYAKASEAFRKEVSLEDFRRYVESRKKALGDFRRVVKTTGGGVSTSTETGTTGKVTMDLEYARGTADAEFQFVKEDGDWRLLHMKVSYDEKLVPPPDRAELEPACRALLRLYDDASFAVLYARFSKPLQEAWKAEQYEPQIRDLRAKAGKAVEATLKDSTDEADGKVRMKFGVRFENGPGDATFAWVAGGGEWHLVGFDLHVGR